MMCSIEPIRRRRTLLGCRSSPPIVADQRAARLPRFQTSVGRLTKPMAERPITDSELLAYLDETLPVERAALVERQLRQSKALQVRMAALIRQRESGAHTVGEIWRQQRLSCPSRTQLGSFLLGTLDAGMAEYIRFHVHEVGCRYCAANLSDLEQKAEAAPEAHRRRRKFFQSSVGFLRGTSRATDQ